MAINLGIVGCGGHAVHHAKNLGEDFTILSAWDPDPERMRAIGAYKTPRNLAELLSDARLDAVMISSPDEHHLAQIKDAIFARKHVFCEKPLLVPGQSIEELEWIFDEAAKRKLVITSCHPRRFDDPFMELRADIQKIREALGDVLNFSFDFSYHKPSSEWKHGRSLLLDHANHEIDLMNFLFGIRGFEAWKLYDSSDRYEIAGRRDDGITFRFSGTRRLNNRQYPEWCRVRFECGEITLDIKHGEMDILYHEFGTGPTINEPRYMVNYDGRLLRTLRSFAQQIRGENAGYLTRSEMLMNTEAGIILQEEGVQRVNVRS